MKPRLLLDTHVLVRWIAEPNRLSREQARALHEAVRRRQPTGISAITLIELVQIFRAGAVRLSLHADTIFRVLETDPAFEVLPISVAVAREVALLRPMLRDPADSIIAATARVHGLRLVTSDQRIIASNVVSTIE